ncbi:MAG TPA: hypothetical protein VLO13_05620 [Halomonas sp.]|nr:hypothetical protein [Halomonas sp.]
MALQLINTGTAANDGTGDTLRSAGQKMNANATELYGLVADTQGALGEKLEANALAPFETSTQLNARDTANRARASHTGTQSAATIIDFAQAAAEAAPVQSVAGKTGAVTLAKGDVGLGQVDNTGDASKPISTATQAALDLKLEEAAIAPFETNAQLNARDTANRDRGNHTGSQPANTITGLAAVATSGAYGDLAGKPIPGLDYDQQAEPVSPSVGHVWRERSAGGLIVNEWEWSGSLWLGRQRYDPLYAAAGASSNTPQVQAVFPVYPVLLTGYSVNLTQPFAPQDSTNFWYFRHTELNINDWLTTIGISTDLPSTRTKTLETPVIITGVPATPSFASKNGSAGNLRNFQVISHYRLIRP